MSIDEVDVFFVEYGSPLKRRGFKEAPKSASSLVSGMKLLAVLGLTSSAVA